MMNWNDLFTVSVVVLQLIASGMYVRSGFYILRVRNKLDWTEKLVYTFPIVFGGYLTLFNLTDIPYAIERFPISQIFNISVAWAIYIFTKSKKENLFTITNVVKADMSKLQVFVMNKLQSKTYASKCVTKEDLTVFELNKYYPSPDGKTALTRLVGPTVGGKKTMQFNVPMLTNGEFGLQYHPSLVEYLFVDEGSVVDLVTGIIYNAGDLLIIPAGTDHNIKALERVMLRAFLVDV